MADGMVDLLMALEAARGLARLVAEEYHTGGSELSITDIARTWTPFGMTRHELDAIAAVERHGGFAGVGDGA